MTFPAYSSTSIDARGKEALESARSALESARRQMADPLYSEANKNELELLKEKTKFLGGIRK